LYVTETCSKS